MQEILLKIWYFEIGLSRSLKKKFFLHRVLFDGQYYEKQKGLRSSRYKAILEISLVWWYNVKW